MPIRYTSERLERRLPVSRLSLPRKVKLNKTKTETKQKKKKRKKAETGKKNKQKIEEQNHKL
ncbi:MAG: hypothetical protein K0U52_12030 [Gammaproteobacteria bacterium]|nr:hypothetical protein [Gammaproteobacteria bacterium]